MANAIKRLELLTKIFHQIKLKFKRQLCKNFYLGKKKFQVEIWQLGQNFPFYDQKVKDEPCAFAMIISAASTFTFRYIECAIDMRC